jgi:hypothetical protein
MKLDIGSDGKIIGTRRVSPNGQVSGLTEFAGREVLVILPGSHHPESSPLWGSGEAVAEAVQEQMREAFERYEVLQKLYATPWEATRSFVRNTFGSSTPDLIAQVDQWVKQQIDNLPVVRVPGSPPRSKGTGAGPGEERRGGKRRARVARTDVSEEFI